MTPEERELRRALAARSGDPSPDFHARVSDALEHALPVPRAMPAVAFVVAAILTVTSVGVLVAVRHYVGTPARSGGPASAGRLVSPAPQIYLPAGVELSAPSNKALWALVDDQALYVSTDAGGSWQKRVPPPNAAGGPNAISFLDQQNGWALYPGMGAGAPATFCGNGLARLWRTTDGALTWTLAAEVDFRASSLGGNGFQDCKDTLTFTDAEHGYVTTWNDGSRPAVWRTSDGGRTWAETIIADPANFTTQAGGFELRLAAIQRFGGTLLAAAYGRQADGPRGYMFVSTDGGATWSVATKLPPGLVTTVTAARWLIIAPGGQSQETVNGGQQWHPYATDYDQAAGVAPQVVFADANVGYAAVRGSIQRTTDGGAHWSSVATPGTTPPPSPAPTPPDNTVPTPPSVQLSAPSASVVWALVAEQRLYLSTDAGASWHLRTLPPYPGGGGHMSFAFVDAVNGWALFPGVPETECNGAGAEIWRTHDGAATWQRVFALDYTQPITNGMEFYQCKESISFIDSRHGFVTAHDPNSRPTIYRTSDGGITWAGTTLPDPPGFVTQGGGFSLSAGTVQNFGGVLLLTATGGQDGDPGPRLYVFRSTDGGTSWAYAAYIGLLPPSGAQLTDFAIVTATRWIAFKGAGGAAVTSDSGAAWEGFSSDYRDASGSTGVFGFPSSQTGFVATGAVVEKTTDGGAHWSAVRTPGT